MKIRSLVIIAIVFISALIVGCAADEICSDPVQSRINIGFYCMKDGVESDTSMQIFSAKGIVFHDSILYDSVSGLQKLSLPLSQLSEESSFIFTFTIPDTDSILDTVDLFERFKTVFIPDTLIDKIIFLPTQDSLTRDTVLNVPHPFTYPLYDTIIFNYIPKLTMISDECGFTHFFDLIEIRTTRNVIKSYSIINPEITTSDEENVKIYF